MASVSHCSTLYRAVIRCRRSDYSAAQRLLLLRSFASRSGVRNVCSEALSGPVLALAAQLRHDLEQNWNQCVQYWNSRICGVIKKLFEINAYLFDPIFAVSRLDAHIERLETHSVRCYAANEGCGLSITLRLNLYGTYSERKTVV